MRKFLLVIFLLSLISLPLFSQQKKKESKAEKKERKEKKKQEKKAKKIPENIEVFSKNFLFKPKFIYPSVIFNVTSRRKDGENFNWYPSMPGLIGAAIRIKKVYAAAVFKLPASASRKEKYGDTKFRDIYINIQGRIVSWGIFYRDYKGYYLGNYTKFYPEWNKDSLGYPKAKNLQVTEAGLNVGFNFNKSFSLNAAFAQSERQKRSAGSFLMTISERYQRIESDSNIVPAGEVDNYPNLNRLKAGNFFTTIIALGAGYQFVYKKFHFTPVVLLGTGVQFQSYQQYDRDRFWINVPTYAMGRTQLGYNGDNFFANIIYSIEFNTIPIKESRIRLYRQAIEFGIGVRF